MKNLLKAVLCITAILNFSAYSMDDDYPDKHNNIKTNSINFDNNAKKEQYKDKDDDIFDDGKKEDSNLDNNIINKMENHNEFNLKNYIKSSSNIRDNNSLYFNISDAKITRIMKCHYKI